MTARTPDAVPWNFSWLVEDRVGGMARPDREALTWLRERGVTAVVSLTERPIEALDGIQLRRHPVPDMTSPAVEDLAGLVDWMRQVTERGGRVVAHCEAGLGRTGTLLAAYLVGDGWSSERAIAHVRRLRPGSIETPGQEEAVHRYAARLGRNGQ